MRNKVMMKEGNKGRSMIAGGLFGSFGVVMGVLLLLGSNPRIGSAQVNGQFVRIELQKGILNLAELEVYSGGKNVALGSKVTLSSTYDNDEKLWGAAHAVDGIKQGGNFAHTADGKLQWLEIDLGKRHEIDRLVVHNRPGFLDRLQTAEIHVLSARRTRAWKNAFAGKPETVYSFDLISPFKVIEQSLGAAAAQRYQKTLALLGAKDEGYQESRTKLARSYSVGMTKAAVKAETRGLSALSDLLAKEAEETVRDPDTTTLDMADPQIPAVFKKARQNFDAQLAQQAKALDQELAKIVLPEVKAYGQVAERARRSGNTTVATAASDVRRELLGHVPLSLQAVILIHLKPTPKPGRLVAANRIGQNGGVIIKEAPELNNVVKVEGGHEHAAALLANGKVVVWGNNGHQQLDAPSGLKDVVDIAVAPYRTLALTRHGRLHIWGKRKGTKLEVPPEAAAGVVAVEANEWLNLAYRADGSCVRWGEKDGKPFVQVSTPPTVAKYNMRYLLTEEGTMIDWEGKPLTASHGKNQHLIDYAENGVWAAVRADGTIAYGDGYHGDWAPVGEYLRSVKGATGIIMGAVCVGIKDARGEWSFHGKGIDNEAKKSFRRGMRSIYINPNQYRGNYILGIR